MSSGEAYYRENYPDYERQNPPQKLDFYMSLVRSWTPPGGRLHELGVGLGAFLARADAEYSCSGSEVNTYGLARARKRAPGATVWQGSFECVPEAPPPDVVVAWDVLEHVAELDEALTCIWDRLPVEGALVAVVPVYDGPLGWLVRLLDRDPTHVSKWPRARWLDTLERHRFEVVASGGVLRRLVLKRWYIHLTRPAWLWRPVGSALWFVARKPSPAGGPARPPERSEG
jgi:SAM-dependent methyltransferase